jgi:hypothetical protein
MEFSPSSFFYDSVITQSMWWRATRTTTPYNRFSPRDARAETAVSIKPE